MANIIKDYGWSTILIVAGILVALALIVWWFVSEMNTGIGVG